MTKTAIRPRPATAGGARCGLAALAPPGVEELVLSVLASDEPFLGLEPMGTPGLNSRLAHVELETAEGPRRYALKRYAHPLVFAWRSIGRRSRARREFEALEALAALVPSPVRAAAWGERRRLGIALRSVLVTELFQDAIDLKSRRLAFARGERPREELASLRAALPELARLLRRLHDAGFFAANAFHKNVLWRPGRPACEAFALMDLPFARLSRGPIGERRRLYDLACLDKDAATILDAGTRLRFYLAYEGRTAFVDGDRERIRRIARERIRREHATLWSRITRSIKKRVKRTAAGKLLTGRDPDQRHRPGR